MAAKMQLFLKNRIDILAGGYGNLFTFAASSSLQGALAQLARAFDWQSKGHRFDSDILHSPAGRREKFFDVVVV